MARSVQAAYRNSRDREVFRETLECDHLGVPLAVRHQDGIVYVLSVEQEGNALYREDLDQHRWNGARADHTGSAPQALGVADSTTRISLVSHSAIVRVPSTKHPKLKLLRSDAASRQRRNRSSPTKPE